MAKHVTISTINSKHTRLKEHDSLSRGRKATSSPRVAAADLLRQGPVRILSACLRLPARKKERQKNNSDAIRRRRVSACGRRDFLMRFEDKVGEMGQCPLPPYGEGRTLAEFL
ncbi:hypothetical protein CDAR_569111 [Caerostris darwini]|uniref:Uncharacterized protein n=1 Tax=Caerostris darwini TaxID=1538125 RepID=A0AAV4QDG3_9ARAC|nr:hypothetical protein CDAR_569111 [Caerostris darwini]